MSFGGRFWDPHLPTHHSNVGVRWRWVTGLGPLSLCHLHQGCIFSHMSYVEQRISTAMWEGRACGPEDRGVSWIGCAATREFCCWQSSLHTPASEWILLNVFVYLWCCISKCNWPTLNVEFVSLHKACGLGCFLLCAALYYSYLWG